MPSNFDTSSDESFQYVPIINSLKALFTDLAVMQQLLLPQQFSGGSSVLNDYSDGAMFKNNIFLGSGGFRIHIILYLDAFEIVNPLGSARSKYKLMAVYYTLGNLHTFSRSKLNAMQLVLLCKEKCISVHNQEQLFAPLISDLKKLETAGVDIGLEERVKGTVVSITDDNLGQHWIGGFTTNFTSALYVCRYCEIQGRDFLMHCDFASPLRTVTSYDNCICNLPHQSENSICGIKHASVFNNLAFYHVCQPGFPPCLAHDLFEGVVAYDVMLILKDLMKKSWFSDDYLSSRIHAFKFDTVVAASKALPIKNHQRNFLAMLARIGVF